MLFNSIEFAIFLPVVFILYWFVFNRNIKLQNLLLLVVSYIFYGWWDWRFLSLIAFSSFVDYFAGLKIEKSTKPKQKRVFLYISLLTNLGFLGVFKYFNFFSASLTEAFAHFGYQLNAVTLNIILPVGISFYTFQTMSYSIDIYNGKLKPCKNIVAFFAYVSFFPQLVAGPIERATNLLPQFYTKRKFTYKNGAIAMYQIIWGLFKKMVIADNCSIIVNDIFANYQSQPGSILLLGMICFAFQIYGDFSGYSDIAIGTARLFGFHLMTNFKTPYFSRDIAEFWRRWHISLSTWFRDYIYIPLGGSRCSKPRMVMNSFIIFLVSGFWHGANWTFIIWGALHALFFLPLLLLKSNRKNTGEIAENKLFPNIKELLQIGSTFLLVSFALIFFRSQSLTEAFIYIKAMFTNHFPQQHFFYYNKEIVILITILISIDWFVFRHDNAYERIFNASPWVRRVGYISIASMIFFLMVNQAQSFIYFQF